MAFDVSAIDWSKVDDHTGRREIETVPGRVALVDADFLAYMATFDDETPWPDMVSNADVMIENLRRASGAEHIELYLTASNSTKGDRFQIAIQKPYQGNRDGKQKPKYLTRMREHLASKPRAVLAMDAEADDYMAERAYGDPKNTVIISKDKDLRMIPGVQMDWDTGEFSDTGNDPWGWIEIDRSKSSPKMVGRGWLFFFGQMLAGDAADNIKGLPKIDNGKGKLVACGAVKAVDFLNDVATGVISGANPNEFFGEAIYNAVRNAYREYDEKEGFFHYEDAMPRRWQEVFISEAKLLWMRRKPADDTDVLDFMLMNCVMPF